MRPPLPTLAVLALLLSACVATPEKRIARAPQQFAALSAEQQAQVKQGQITVGMPAAGVRLAIGEPDRVLERANSEGKTEVWQYLEVFSAGPGPCFGSFYRGYYPGYCSPFYQPFYQPQVAREVLRINFKDGMVLSYERER